MRPNTVRRIIGPTINIDTLRDARLIYLATPYTKFPGGIEVAFQEAARLTGKLLLAGLKVYSPIAHTHPVAIHGNIDPLDHSIWMPFDGAMMDAASHLLVAMMPTWRQSYGIKVEIDTFRRDSKPVFFLDPATMSVDVDRDHLGAPPMTDTREREDAKRSIEKECDRLREALAVAERESSQLLELINAPETAVLREALAAAESRASAAERERDEARADQRRVVENMQLEADAAMELLKECGEVLEPFVEVANVYPKWADNARATCPMSDYRRARTALSRIREHMKEEK